MELNSEKFVEASEYIKARIENIPDTVIVLGSGLNSIVSDMDIKVSMDYKDIPHFSTSTVEGHKGELIYGELNYAPVLIMNGRIHYYEGYDVDQITFPIRVFKTLGVKNIILTNAAGGINLDYAPGDFMVIRDHINFSGISPLRGKNLDEFGVRFPDMTTVYDEEYMALTEQIACELGIIFNEGVYAYLQGPSYETPSEIKALRIMGADAVGMSTVPEAVVARHCGLRVIGISCITNMAAGILKSPLTHEEVQETSNLVKDKFINWIKLLIRALYLKGKNNMAMLGEGNYSDGIDG